MSAGGSVLATHEKRRRASPKKSRAGQGQGRRAHGVDLTAIAEDLLFPGVSAERLTVRQMWQAAHMAKAHLVELGLWPDSTNDRHERERAADRQRAVGRS